MHDPWRTNEYDFPDASVVSERLLFLVNYAVLAPSSHNTQPWLFEVDDDAIAIRADRTRSLPVVDPRDRELTISCGAALGHLQVAMRHFGYKPKIDMLPAADDPDLLARVGFGEPVEPTLQDERLFQAIQKRRTNRHPFEPACLPEDVVKDLEASAAVEDVDLRLIADARAREKIALLIGEADRIQFADAAFRQELSSWIRSKRDSSHDGMSGDGFGMPDSMSSIGASIIRTFDLGRGVAAKDKRIAAGSPTLAVLATAHDEPYDWLRTGQILSNMLLILTAAGLSASYLNQPVEVSSLRNSLQRRAAVTGTPQLLLRLGYGPKVEPSARRTVEESLVATVYK